MNAYKQSLESIYTDWKVDQVDAKNLFILTRCGEMMAFSYRTIIMRKRAAGTVRITSEKFSTTTTRHCNVLAGIFSNNTRVPEVF